MGDTNVNATGKRARLDLGLEVLRARCVCLISYRIGNTECSRTGTRHARFGKQPGHRQFPICPSNYHIRTTLSTLPRQCVRMVFIPLVSREKPQRLCMKHNSTPKTFPLSPLTLTLTMLPVSQTLVSTPQSSAFSFTEMLMDRSDSGPDFMSTTSSELTGMSSALLTPHIDPTLLASPFGHATGAPIPLAGTDSPAFVMLQRLYQQREGRLRQIAQDYDRLRCVPKSYLFDLRLVICAG